MTATSSAISGADATAVRPSTARSYRFELIKLASQWRVRVLVLLCWSLPAAFVVVVSKQDSLPSDTLFGRWMHASGWAGPLVMLGFAGTWALPLLTSVVAGDVFSSEDRLGTWRHLLVAVGSPRRIFVAKALASVTVLLALVCGLAASSIVGGLAAVGNHPLAGIDGHLLTSGQAAGTVVVAWICAIAPTLALAALGLLGSVTLGRSPIGLLVPALFALTMQLAQVLPLPVCVRLALPGYAFIGWNGLFGRPAQLAPLLIAVAVSLVWAVSATTLAYLLFVRRDFGNTQHDRTTRRAIAVAVLPLAALLAATVFIVALSTGATGSGIDQNKVERSVATAFAHLYRLQTAELHRPDVTEAQLATSATCTRGGGMIVASGAGNDWRCTVSWHLPDVGAATGTAIYQLDVSSNGRYIADGDGPQDVNGYFLLHTDLGNAPNPLWQFDGVVDLLSSTS